MSLTYNELKPGTFIILDNQPYEVLEFEFLRMQQRKPVSKTKLKSLITGKVKEQTFHQSDEIEKAELEKIPSRFLYESKGVYWFDEVSNPKNRFSFQKEEIGDSVVFLKANFEVTALKFEDKIINIELPIKADYKVIEAPPAIKGDTASGGGKTVTLETGAKINVPFFISEGDIVKVNTQTGEYVERVEKGN
jgi:elongation factor P